MLSDSCHFAYKGNTQLPRQFLLRYPRCDVTYSALHSVLMGKVYSCKHSMDGCKTFNSVIVRTPCDFLGHGSVVGYHQVKKGLLLTRGTLELKLVKHIYTCYLLVITQLSFQYLHAVTRELFLQYIVDSHAFAGFWQAKLCYVCRHFGLVHNAES